MPSINDEKRKRPWYKVKKNTSVGFNGNNRHVYDNPRWRKLSKKTREKNRRCYSCKKLFAETRNLVLDHIIPISHKGDPWAEENQGVMCNRCHNKKSGQESHATWPIYMFEKNPHTDFYIPVYPLKKHSQR